MKPASIQLGPYQLVERIGEGGSGQVFRAHGPNGPVAIKMLGPASDMDEAAQARFQREIAALAQLGHPQLVALIDHGVDPELGPYLVLPLLAGVNLRRLCAGRALCPEAALLLLHPVAEATAALHAAGYVHRDLKPENVIAGPDGTITVIDLGLAWREGMTRHTDTGAAVGSVGYMSPEQIEARTVDDRADVWALGVMLYEWIVGARPFARARPAEEAAAMMLGRFPRLTAADRRAGEELAELVARCLELEPTRRPSAARLVAEITAMIDWTDTIATDRAAVVADPAGYQARIAPLRVRRVERLARDAIADGQPFVALGWCDRGLAYMPDHAGLLALVASAELATARAVPPAAPPALALAPSVPAVPPAAVAAPTEPMRRRWSRRWSVVTAALGIAVGAIAVYAVIPSRSPRDAWTGRAPAPPTTTLDVTPSSRSTEHDRDRELVGDFISLFSQAMATGGPRAGGDDLNAPSTATGWLARAATESPADAVVSIRHALAMSPGWSDAQAALCAALAASQDDGAVAACTIAIARRPTDVGMLAARATAQLHTGKFNEALRDLDRAVAADPDPKWRRLRAKARRAAGDQPGAKHDLDSACQLGDAVSCADAKRAPP